MYPTNARQRQLHESLGSRREQPVSDTGASTVEVLAWAAMSVLAIVAIGGALQVLGLDIINNVRSQLGV